MILIQQSGVPWVAYQLPDQMKPDMISTKGYRQEIQCLHFRQCPARRMKLKTGMLSYQAIGLAQDGQYEHGLTIDSSSGRRWIRTFKKLPTIRPMTKSVASVVKRPAPFLIRGASSQSGPAGWSIMKRLRRLGKAACLHRLRSGAPICGPHEETGFLVADRLDPQK